MHQQQRHRHNHHTPSSHHSPRSHHTPSSRRRHLPTPTQHDQRHSPSNEHRVVTLPAGWMEARHGHGENPAKMPARTAPPKAHHLPVSEARSGRGRGGVSSPDWRLCLCFHIGSLNQMQQEKELVESILKLVGLRSTFSAICIITLLPYLIRNHKACGLQELKKVLKIKIDL